MNLNPTNKLNHVLIIFAAVLIAVIAFWSYTRATGTVITACVGKDGSVFVVGQGFKQTTCTNNQTPLSWNIQGPQGVQGPTGPSGANLSLYDANGQLLGTLIGFAPSAVFSVVIPNTSYAFSIQEIPQYTPDNSGIPISTLYKALSGDIVFANANCDPSGGVYFSHPLINAATDQVSVGPNGSGYVIDPNNTGFMTLATSPQSVFRPNLNECNNEATSSIQTFLKAKSIGTLPFSLPIQGPLQIR